ncbi:MAG TPA: ABC transporter permease [Isosphaeraceae bacterium]|jgi:hypothetical protein|nr:ABC transporter permease [Isosphaeraceae bacterium]
MLPGPVFNVELLTSARRLRYYVVRVLYGTLLLLILYQNYQALDRWGRGNRGAYSSNELTGFAMETFSTFAVAQSIAVLALTPALVAGVIAVEKQRKTLHYLLASRLSSAEIVLGKLMARLLHVGVFVAIGLPVVSLLTLFGGIDPVLIGFLYAGTATTVFLLAALSIFVSTVSKRPRDAILVVYLLELVWLVVPPLVKYAIPDEWEVMKAVLPPPNEWVYATHPAAVIEAIFAPTTMVASGRVSTPNAALAWFCGLQGGVALLLVALAVWQVRRSFQAQEGGSRWGFVRALTRRRLRIFPRPALGDDPMLWKELHVARLGGLARFVAFAISLVALVGLCYGVTYFAQDAFDEVATYGYGSAGSVRGRENFNGFCRVVTAILYVLCLLGTAAAAAGAVTSEREGDQWISLVATDLTGGEIVRAKIAGAIWGVRRIALALVLVWAIATAAGALHPFGFLAASACMAVFLWFAAGLGTLVSLVSRTTTRSLVLTVGTLIVLNGGYLLCCLPTGADTQLVLSGVSPAIQVISLLGYVDVWELFGFETSNRWSTFSGPRGVETVGFCVLGFLFYACGALALTMIAIGTFDRMVDRPDRASQKGPPPPRPVKPVKTSPEIA